MYPALTESIDAITGLIAEKLPGWALSSHCPSSSHGYRFAAGLSPYDPTDEWTHSDCGGVDVTASTEPLARCAALLRALSAKEG